MSDYDYSYDYGYGSYSYDDTYGYTGYYGSEDVVDDTVYDNSYYDGFYSATALNTSKLSTAKPRVRVDFTNLPRTIPTGWSFSRATNAYGFFGDQTVVAANYALYTQNTGGYNIDWQTWSQQYGTGHADPTGSTAWNNGVAVYNMSGSSTWDFGWYYDAPYLGSVTGQTWTFGMWVKGNLNETIRIKIGNQFNPTDFTATLVTLTGSWQQISVTHTFTGNPASLRYGLLNDAGTTVTTIDVWRPQLEPGSALGEFIPNLSNNSAALTYAEVMSSVGINVPRFLTAADGTERGLLIEPGKTNYFYHSESDTGWNTPNGATGWTVSSGSVSSAAGMSPADGSTYHQASLWTPASGYADHALTAPVGGYLMTYTKMTYSVFVKPTGSLTKVQLVQGDPTNAGTALLQGNALPVAVNFDLTGDGSFLVMGLTSNATSKTNTYNGTFGHIEKMPNGWYRIGYSGPGIADYTASQTPAVILRNVDSISAPAGSLSTANGSDGFLVWGWQVESQSNAPTSYIPTNGSQGFRTDELLEFDGISNAMESDSGDATVICSVEYLTEAPVTNTVPITMYPGSNNPITVRQSNYGDVSTSINGNSSSVSYSSFNLSNDASSGWPGPFGVQTTAYTFQYNESANTTRYASAGWISNQLVPTLYASSITGAKEGLSNLASNEVLRIGTTNSYDGGAFVFRYLALFNVAIDILDSEYDGLNATAKYYGYLK